MTEGERAGRWAMLYIYTALLLYGLILSLLRPGTSGSGFYERTNSRTCRTGTEI